MVWPLLTTAFSALGGGGDSVADGAMPTSTATSDADTRVSFTSGAFSTGVGKMPITIIAIAAIAGIVLIKVLK